MNFKSALTLSAILHLCSFAVVLVSVDLFGNSSRKSNEEIVFIKLVEDAVVQSVVKPKRLLSKTLQKITTEEKTVSKIQDEIIPVKTETENKTNNSLNLTDSNAQGKTINILFTSYKISENNVIDIPYGQEIGTNNSYGKSSNDGGISDSKDLLPQGIIEAIRNSIEKVKTYPVLARKRGIEGTVYISFRINSEGRPQDIKVLKSSGYSILDTATLEILKKAAPYPYLESPIEVPVVFRLNE